MQSTASSEPSSATALAHHIDHPSNCDQISLTLGIIFCDGYAPLYVALIGTDSDLPIRLDGAWVKRELPDAGRPPVATVHPPLVSRVLFPVHGSARPRVDFAQKHGLPLGLDPVFRWAFCHFRRT
jgi:hypothetical protein